VGHSFDPVFKGENPPAPCAYDWGPTAETADQLLYSVTTDDEIVIYRLKGAGAQHPGEKLATISKEKYQFITDLRWLPDGSGFLYAGADLAYSFANILRYDLATRQTVPVTNFEETFVKEFSVSPDGKSIVFERTKGFVDSDADLWIVGMDGKGLRLLTKNANHPAWGR
jgi:Tol biopolymer transport system component